MPRASPTLEGFRAVFHRPSLALAEIAWRWTVGAVAWGLFLFWSIEYLGSLPVTGGDAALLRTRQPLLVGRAIAHILRGSLNRAVLAALLAALALALLWIVAASLGRAVTVRAVLRSFRADICSDVSPSFDAINLRSLRSLIGLNFLRAVLTLAALLAFVGAANLVGIVSPAANPKPGFAFVCFLPLAGLICVVWPALNWLLSLACIFAVRDGGDVLSALFAAVTFFRERLGAVLAVSTWIGLAHFTALSVATTAASFPLAFIQVAPARLIAAGVIVVTLTYFAVVDWLYMARLAGYLFIAEMPDAVASSEQLPASPPQTSIDREEPILSDVPNLVVDT